MSFEKSHIIYFGILRCRDYNDYRSVYGGTVDRKVPIGTQVGYRVDKVSVVVDKYRGFVNLYIDGWGWFVYSGHRCMGCRDCRRVEIL